MKKLLLLFLFAVLLLSSCGGNSNTTTTAYTPYTPHGFAIVSNGASSGGIKFEDFSKAVEFFSSDAYLEYQNDSEKIGSQGFSYLEATVREIQKAGELWKVTYQDNETDFVTKYHPYYFGYGSNRTENEIVMETGFLLKSFPAVSIEIGKVDSSILEEYPWVETIGDYFSLIGDGYYDEDAAYEVTQNDTEIALFHNKTSYDAFYYMNESYYVHIDYVHGEWCNATAETCNKGWVEEILFLIDHLQFEKIPLP